MNEICLIIGLGNPGVEYENTRHNAGFWFIDDIAIKHKVNMNMEGKFFGFVGKFRYQNRDVYLLKPQTYMNLSGKSVLAIMNFFKITPSQVLVVHDELDFDPGTIRFKFGGGNGGHNGLRDIDRVIGKDYLRLRIGIGHPGDRNKVASYVLKPPSRDDMIEIKNGIDKAVATLDMVLSGELNSAMKQLHS